MALTLQDQYDKIYKYCYFKVKHAHLAEDLTQETFLRYFRQSTYIDRGKPLAYLYTIAKNLCADAYKKTEATSFLDDDIAYEENIFDNLETSVAVRQAVESLSKDMQELILLRYANDLSMAEISAITGLSRFAVYRKINGALSKLKLILREEDFT